MTTRSSSTGRGVLYSVTAGTASIAAGLALLPLIINSVGAGPYGAWLFLIAISSYFNYTDLGVGTAIIHFGSRARGGSDKFSMSELLSAGIAWTAIIGMVVLPIYWFISWSYLSAVSQSAGIPASEMFLLTAMATAIACGLIIRPFSGVLVGSGYLLLERKFQFWGVVVRVLGTVTACTFYGSVSAVAVAEALALLTPTILAVGAVYSKRIACVRITRSLWLTLKQMMSFSTHAFAVSIASAVISNGGTLMIGIVGSPAQVTYFAAATRVLTGVGQITGWASLPFQPTLSRLYHSAPEQAKNMLTNLVFSSFSVAAISCGLIISAAYPAVELWLGRGVDHSEVATIMSILLLGAVLNSLHRPLFLAAEASGKPGLFFRTQSLVAVAFGVLGFVLGAHFGAVGIAVARLIPIVLVSPFYILISGNHFGLGFDAWWKNSLLPAGRFVFPSVLLAIGATFISSHLSTQESEWLPAIVYGLSCCLFIKVFLAKLPLTELKATLRSSM